MDLIFFSFSAAKVIFRGGDLQIFMLFLSTPPQFLPTSEIFLLFKVKMMQKSDVTEIFYQNHKRNRHPLRLFPIKNAPFW
jgi:hypothetical protein